MQRTWTFLNPPPPPPFYYAVFVWILREFHMKFFLACAWFFRVAWGFRAWTDVSTHDAITSSQNFFSAKEDIFSLGKMAALHCFRKYTNTYNRFCFWMNFSRVLSVCINIIWILKNIAVCMANHEHPDQALISAASDLGLHCLHRPICPNS